MKFALVVLVAALSVATVAGLAVQPTCPEWALDDASLPSLQQFTANVFHYNKDNVMSGSPVGPYFSINEAAGCTWYVLAFEHLYSAKWLYLCSHPYIRQLLYLSSLYRRENGAFNCNLIIYSSAARSRQIGSGLLSSTNLIWNHDAFNTSGGSVTLTTNINSAQPAGKRRHAIACLSTSCQGT